MCLVITTIMETFSWKSHGEAPQGGKELGIRKGVHAHYFNKVGKAVCTVRTASPNSEAKIHGT